MIETFQENLCSDQLNTAAKDKSEKAYKNTLQMRNIIAYVYRFLDAFLIRSIT